MKIQYMSDLHLEFGNTEGEMFLPEPVGDVLILAGDIITVHGLANVDSKKNRYKKLFDHASANWKHVFFIAGNHEYYKWNKSNVPSYLRQWVNQWDNVHFFENDTMQIDGITFVGATLWTDFFGGQERYAAYVAGVMNDYASHTYLTTSMTADYHQRSKGYIEYVAKNNDKVVVFTHHAPSSLSSHPKYAGDMANAGYYSNMEEFLEQLPSIKYWIHGHMHNPSDYMIGQTKVVANPRGYPHEANYSFDPMKTFDI